jgi:hypothetical protein
MKTILLAATAVCLAIPVANATQIISFGQTSQTNTIAATDNGTVTTISMVNAAVLIDQLFGITTPPAIDATMNLTATSIDAALTVGAAFVQHYTGSFSIIGAGAVNELSGTFSDAAFGTSTGGQLSINVAAPPDTLTLSSDVINAADLTLPGSFTLSMSNILSPPGLHLDGTTIAAFDASFSGVANATTVSAPEPTSMALLGVGLLGLGFIVRKRGTHHV